MYDDILRSISNNDNEASFLLLDAIANERGDALITVDVQVSYRDKYNPEWRLEAYTAFRWPTIISNCSRDQDLFNGDVNTNK